MDIISIRVLEVQATAKHNPIMSLLGSFRDQVSTNEELVKKIDRSELVEKAIYQADMQPLKELQCALSEFGGQAYMYEYDSPSVDHTKRTSEEGYMVISGGEIKKKAGILAGELLQ
jgi:hypothetical protein